MNNRPTIIPLSEPILKLESWSTMQEAGAKIRHAQADWKSRCVDQRLAILRVFREKVAAEPLSLLRAVSSARPAAEMLSAEILPLLDACRFLEKNGRRLLKPRKLGRRGRPIWLFGHSAEVQRVDWGVVLIIAPANYPILLPGVQLLQALTAGNGVLLKPGPGGSAAARAIVRLLEASGLPADLVEILSEDKDAGRMALYRDADKVFFTGSAVTGSRILQELAPQLVPSAMELSGSDAMVVLEDADLHLSAKALSFGLHLNQGQICIAPRRIFVAASRLQEFLQVVRTAFQERECFALPLRRIAGFLPHLGDALDNGATLVAGSDMTEGEPRFPFVVSNVPRDSALWSEDFFLPVAAVAPFETEQDLLTGLKQSPYALGASIFTADCDAAKALATKLKVGVISINDLIVPTADPRLPFGGRGRSGFGVTRGAEGLLEMTAVKVVTTRSFKWRPHYAEPQSGDGDLFAHFLQLVHSGSWKQRFSSAIKLFRLGASRRRPSSHARNILKMD
ncbi:MAG: aldehyde dehydrogenase [Verrucomicrobiales bacterium]|nr:aldehyde dehydrogenase [Verrucomicrobiales bacterium]